MIGTHLRLVIVILAVIVTMGLSAHSVSAQYGAPHGEWPTYAGDLGGTKYSGLDQIDAGNFNDLQIAWRWSSADGALDLDALREIHTDLSILNMRVTPLMIGGTVYAVTPLRLAVALDAGTGDVRWIHDPDVIRSTKQSINAPGYSSRGLAYWTDGSDERLYYGTPDGYLLAINAKTGEAVRTFGTNGRVDLASEIPRGGRGTTDNQGYPWISVNSPPIVAHDVVVTPTSISDQPITKNNRLGG